MERKNDSESRPWTVRVDEFDHPAMKLGDLPGKTQAQSRAWKILGIAAADIVQEYGPALLIRDSDPPVAQINRYGREIDCPGNSD